MDGVEKWREGLETGVFPFVAVTSVIFEIKEEIEFLC